MRRPGCALTFIELALVRADRLTATERARLYTARARALAKLGRVHDAVTAVDVADEEFSDARPADTPLWMTTTTTPCTPAKPGTHYGRWECTASSSSRHATRLAAAVAGHDGGRTRLRAMSQTKLASLIMVTGDPREAAALGAQALDAVGTLRSRRAADEFRELRRFSEPHVRLAEVAELRHRIGTVVAA